MGGGGTGSGGLRRGKMINFIWELEMMMTHRHFCVYIELNSR
jgi:hypothetical protein